MLMGMKDPRGFLSANAGDTCESLLNANADKGICTSNEPAGNMGDVLLISGLFSRMGIGADGLVSMSVVGDIWSWSGLSHMI